MLSPSGVPIGLWNSRPTQGPGRGVSVPRDEGGHDLFTRDEDPKARASQARPPFADAGRTIVNRKENAATETAALIIPAVGNNKLRHETLQRFMLANDSVTLAVEIPIWLTEPDIEAIEQHYAIELAPKTGAPRAITGHIDFLQLRNGAVHILDYKPDARINKPIAQLTIYALALARLTGIKLFDIKCAWFNEHEYCEFFPRTLFSPHPFFPAPFFPTAKRVAPPDAARRRTFASRRARPRPISEQRSAREHFCPPAACTVQWLAND
jgi:hypothetical protein